MSETEGIVVDPVADREQSLATQLAGSSRAATQAEAEAGLAEARQDLAKSGSFAIGLGLMKVWPFLDYDQYAFVVTDGTRQANLYVKVSGTELALLEGRGEDVDAWVRARVRSITIAIPRAADRYAELLLAQHLRFL